MTEPEEAPPFRKTLERWEKIDADTNITLTFNKGDLDMMLLSIAKTQEAVIDLTNALIAFGENDKKVFIDCLDETNKSIQDAFVKFRWFAEAVMSKSKEEGA